MFGSHWPVVTFGAPRASTLGNQYLYSCTGTVCTGTRKGIEENPDGILLLSAFRYADEHKCH